MVNEGDMVRAGGYTMRVVSIFESFARCIRVDNDGAIRNQWFDLDDLVPLADALRPRCLWPSKGDLEALGLLEIEREEKEATAARKASLKASRKARRSNRIKRKVAA